MKEEHFMEMATTDNHVDLDKCFNNIFENLDILIAEYEKMTKWDDIFRFVIEDLKDVKSKMFKISCDVF